MMTREKEEGRKAALRAIQEDLGCSPEEAKAILDAHRQREESEKSEAQRAREAAEREQAEAKTAKEEAAAERHAARVDRVLLRSGVTPERAERVARLIDVEVGAEEDAIGQAVESLKKEMPELFGRSGGGGAPPGDPPGTPPAPKPREDDAFKRGYERGREAAGPRRYAHEQTQGAS